MNELVSIFRLGYQLTLYFKLYGFAWTSLGPAYTPWIAPMIFSAIIAIANLAIYSELFSYSNQTADLPHSRLYVVCTIDCKLAAEALVAHSITR